MRISRKVRIVLISFVVAVAAGVVTVWMTLPRIERWGVGFHQKSVTRSLAAWALEDAKITNDASEIHAAEMIGYMSTYYVPGPGYRGPLEVEATLEKQRQESIARVAASLEHYTGLVYGTNAQCWSEWAAEREKQLAVRKSSEPEAPANGRLPIRAETNSTSGAAGSRR